VATARLAVLPPAALPWIDVKGVYGYPTQAFAQFMTAFSVGNIGPLVSATDDAAAAKAGVPVNGIYQSNGTVKVRLT
jgi:hypothetical protein